MDSPLRFIPFVRPMVWGGRRLGDVLGKPLAEGQLYGESWEISDHPLHRSVVATGPLKGLRLCDLMERDRAGLLGNAAGSFRGFPWLVKFLDASDWLSVQVHPDENAVKALWPGEGSKTEAWFVLDVAPSGRVYAGLMPGINEKKLRAALEAGTVEGCLHSFEPKPGDCIFLPAGTVHAVGGGVLLAEVQQTSDATFRLFDWNRRDAEGKTRTLHLREGLASIDWKQGPVQPVRANDFGPHPGNAAVGMRRQVLVRCPYFALDYQRSDQPFTLRGEGSLQCVVILQGSGQVVHAGGDEDVTPGQVWLLPAAMTDVRFHPRDTLGMLHCSLPETT